MSYYANRSEVVEATQHYVSQAPTRIRFSVAGIVGTVAALALILAALVPFGSN